MIMSIEGEFTDLALAGHRHLSGVEMTSSVYSKRQARVEFERFLTASGLPDQTVQEVREEQERLARSLDVALDVVQSVDNALAKSEEKKRQRNEVEE